MVFLLCSYHHNPNANSRYLSFSLFKVLLGGFPHIPHVPSPVIHSWCVSLSEFIEIIP